MTAIRLVSVNSAAVRSLLRFIVYALLCASPFAFGAPTDLDPAFGDGGVARIPNASRADRGALFPDGGLAVVVDLPATYDSGDLIIRLDGSGRVDRAFTAIMPVAPQEPNEQFQIRSLAVTRTGHVVAFQSSYFHPICKYTVTRYLPNGAPDPSFGQGGRSRVFQGLRVCATSDLVLDSGERVYFSAGFSALSVFSAWITRMGATSTPVETLGTMDFVSVHPESYGPLALQADGKLVAVVQSSVGNHAVTRLADTVPDPTFGVGGVARFQLPGESRIEDVQIAADGKIIAAGTAQFGDRRQFIIARLTPNGVLDTTFGEAGVAYIAAARPGESVISARAAVQSDGRVVVAGTVRRLAAPNEPFARIAVARLTVDGQPDARFAGGGVTDFWRERGADFSFLMLRPDDRVVVGGAIWKSYSYPFATTEAVVLQFAGGDLPASKPLRERQVIEYFHAGQGHYFLTTDPEEIAILDTAVPAAWARTGRVFQVWDENDGTLSPVCRFWSDQSFAPKSSHFYSPYADECASLKTGSVWRFERDAFFLRMPQGTPGARTCPAGSQPLYRAYNNGMTGAPNHRYTPDIALLNEMIAQGWAFEGEAQTKVFACVPVQ